MSKSLMSLKVVLLLFALRPNVNAHDLWLLPPSNPKPNEKTHVLAISGTKFPKGDVAPNPSRFAKRMVVSPAGKQSEAIADGTSEEMKAGLLAWIPTDSGIYSMAVQTTPRIIQLDAEAFNHYLVSDGLSHIYLQRWKEKSLNKSSVERYSKSPKVLIQVGDGKAGDPTKPMGLPLEIVPLTNPFQRKPGDTLQVRVLFQGKSLAGASLGWDHPGESDLPAGTVRTNAEGEAFIPVSQVGLMTIRLTHMTQPKTAEYEWESFWTTLTFRIDAGK